MQPKLLPRYTRHEIFQALVPHNYEQPDFACNVGDRVLLVPLASGLGLLGFQRRDSILFTCMLLRAPPRS